MRRPHDRDPAHGAASPRPRGSGHFAEPIIREIRRLSFLDGSQHKARHELRLVAVGVIGRRSAAGRISHTALAEVRRGDKRVDLSNDDAVFLQLGAVMNAVPELLFTMLPPPCIRIRGITACIATIGPSALRWKISSNKAGSISSTEAA
jgi:hypothetical protein